MHINKKTFIILFCTILLFCIFLILFITNRKPSFELQNERIIPDYSISTSKGEFTGLLYEQDVLSSGKVTSKIANEYIQTIEIPEKSVAIRIKFYNSHDKKSLCFERYENLIGHLNWIIVS